LDEDQWLLVKEAIGFYGQVAPIIARGNSRVYQKINPSWQHLQGAQAVSRISEDGQSALIVMHSFGMPLPDAIRVPLPGDGWHVAGSFPKSAPSPIIMGNELCFQPTVEWEGLGLYLKRD
jgi:hypothetical protein